MTDNELLTLIRENPEQGIHEMMVSFGGAVGTICRNFLYDFKGFRNSIIRHIGLLSVTYEKSQQKNLLAIFSL